MRTVWKEDRIRVLHIADTGFMKKWVVKHARFDIHSACQTDVIPEIHLNEDSSTGSHIQQHGQ